MLIDGFGRPITYLRLSVTDRCDLRCVYCLPAGFDDFEPKAHWLSDDGLVRLVGLFAKLGVRRLRLTGGEPLTRRGLPALAARFAQLPGIEDISLSTNGVQLTRHATALVAAGVKRINVSLDSLNEARFARITGGGKLDKVLAGLDAAARAGLTPIKINMVVMGGINDDEVEGMLDFCARHDYTLRLIEPMPVGDTGRHAGQHFVSLAETRAHLERRFDLIPAVMPGGGPARYAQLAGTTHRVGFITPRSQHFCESCNRVRLGPDGTLNLCLGQDDQAALGPLIRNGVSDADLQDAILAAIARKPERHHFNERPSHIVRFMARTGG